MYSTSGTSEGRPGNSVHFKGNYMKTPHRCYRYKKGPY